MRLAVVATCLATFSATTAHAQLPFFGGDEEKPAKKKSKKDDDGEDAVEKAAPQKTYTKPEARALPEGPVETLSGPVALVRFKGIVNPGMGEFTVSSIARAGRDGAQAVLIEIDTPGGLVSTTQSIVQAIMASKLPVIVFVSPSGAHAASAGTIITLAGHVAAMAPATRIGAAHPVTGSGKDPEDEGGVHMGRKVENDLAAMVEGIAAERGRNVEWAVDAVRQSVSVHATKALEIGVIDLIARSRDDLFDQLDGRVVVVQGKKVQLATKGVKTVEYELSMREQLVNMLANPGIAMLLGILGLIGIMVEIYHPGMIAPGVMGALCLICSLIAMEQLPIDLGGAILVIAGIGLLIAEIYAPTYGTLGVLGAIGLVFGLVLVVDPDKPGFALDKSFGLGVVEVLPLAALLLGFVVYLSAVVIKTKRRRPITGTEGMIGSVGTVLKPVDRSGGTVLVLGEYWKARADEAIPEKEEIEVVSVQGLELTVRRRSHA